MDSLLSIVQMPAGVPVADLRHRQGRRGQCGPVRRGRAGADRCRRRPKPWRPSAPQQTARRCSTNRIRAADDLSSGRHEHRRHPRRRPAGAHAGAWPARRWALRFLVLDTAADACAGQFAPTARRRTGATRRRWRNSPARIDVATFDFENVPAETARWLTEPSACSRIRGPWPWPRTAWPRKPCSARSGPGYAGVRRRRYAAPTWTRRSRDDRHAGDPQDAAPGLRRQGPVPPARAADADAAWEALGAQAGAAA